MDHIFNRSYVHADILGQQIIREKAVPWGKGFKYHLVVISAVIFCSLVFVWSRLEVVQVGYEISQSNKIYQERIRENQRLRVEVSSLRSPSRIEEMARKNLGFINPKQEQIFLIP